MVAAGARAKVVMEASPEERLAEATLVAALAAAAVATAATQVEDRVAALGAAAAVGTATWVARMVVVVHGEETVEVLMAAHKHLPTNGHMSVGRAPPWWTSRRQQVDSMSTPLRPSDMKRLH